MSNTYFKFKQFTVFQDKTAMKVGVDGVLLGTWAKTSNAKTILDIGTGTGLLSLMMAQKSDASITAIDIDPESNIQAQFNFKQSIWSDRISSLNVSFQEFCSKSDSIFDLIICNPPYFVQSMKSPDEKRNIARHDDLLPLDFLFSGVSKLLSSTGRFVMIYPFEKRANLYNEAKKNNLFLTNELIIRGTVKKNPNRIIVEFSRINQICNSAELVVRDALNNDYTIEYKNLTKDFYIAF